MNDNSRKGIFLKEDSKVVGYMVYPRFLMGLELNETAKLIYVLLLDRARLSMTHDGWEDENGHVFIYYTIDTLAAATGKCAMTIKDALKKLEEEKLIFRYHQGAGKPSKIYVRVQTENCLPDGQDSVPVTDRKLSTSNNDSNNNRKRTRNYDFEEGESL